MSPPGEGLGAEDASGAARGGGPWAAALRGFSALWGLAVVLFLLGGRGGLGFSCFFLLFFLGGGGGGVYLSMCLV